MGPKSKKRYAEPASKDLGCMCAALQGTGNYLLSRYVLTPLSSLKMRLSCCLRLGFGWDVVAAGAGRLGAEYPSSEAVEAEINYRRRIERK